MEESTTVELAISGTTCSAKMLANRCKRYFQKIPQNGDTDKNPTELVKTEYLSESKGSMLSYLLGGLYSIIM